MITSMTWILVRDILVLFFLLLISIAYEYRPFSRLSREHKAERHWNGIYLIFDTNLHWSQRELSFFPLFSFSLMPFCSLCILWFPILAADVQAVCLTFFVLITVYCIPKRPETCTPQPAPIYGTETVIWALLWKHARQTAFQSCKRDTCECAE